MHVRFAVTAVGAAIVSTALIGCSGGGASTSTSVAPAATVAATLRIDIPPVVSPLSRPHLNYISPSTRSIAVDFLSPGATVPSLSIDENLTPDNPNCLGQGNARVCTISFQISPGIYEAHVALFDGDVNAQRKPSGNALSAGQIGSVTFGIGQPNKVFLTLDGIPRSVHISSPSQAVRISPKSDSITFYGLASQTIQLDALDADGNTIVGPGAPAFNLVSNGGFTVKTMPGSTNTFTLVPPGVHKSNAVLSVTAVSPALGCSEPSAACTATVTVQNNVQTLFVATAGPPVGTAGPASAVQALVAPYTTSRTTLMFPGGNVLKVTSLAANAAGDCIVGIVNQGIESGVFRYVPPYKNIATVIGTFSYLETPIASVFDAQGDLFVAKQGAPDSVFEYGPTSSGPLATVTGSVKTPVAVAADAAANLYVANAEDNTVREYAPPYGAPLITIGKGMGIENPTALAIDATGRLFVENVHTLTTYSPIDTITTPTTTPMQGGTLKGLAIDALGNVFVGVAGGPVLEYAPPYTNPPIAAIGSGTQGLTVDGAGDLFVIVNKSVLEYAPPYNTLPVVTIPFEADVTLLALTP
ncbi:MAG: hypothetical protein NVSMB64_11370 [Candidatus Velthaea sp.]